MASTVVATLPLAVWINDTFFKLCRVHGSSMEPTLLDGDVVVVRLSDGFWQQWTRKLPVNETDDDANSNSDIGRRRKDTVDIQQHGLSGITNQRTDYNKDDIRWDYERRKVLKYESEYCNVNPNPNVWLRRPPVPVAGDIVVFHDPSTYGPSSAWNIKRVIGLGGQMVITSLVVC
jgi:signal peptidase I